MKSNNTPLAQAHAKRKLQVAIPGCALACLLLYFDVAPEVTRLFAVLLGGYAIVGAAELLMGESLVSAGRKWDLMPGWKKFVISLVVVIVAFFVFMSLIPLAARVIY